MALTRLGSKAITTVENSAITLDAAEIPNLDASKITTGTLANARIAEASVTQHVTATDLQPIKSDISALALREATNESSAAFNLPNQFIDTFATDVLGTKTDVAISSGAVITETTTTTSETDGSTSFTDASGNHSTITASNTAWDDTYGGCLGGGVGIMNRVGGNEGYLNIANDNSFLHQPGSSNFTLELFVNRVASSTHRGVIGLSDSGVQAYQIATNPTVSLFFWGSTNGSGWDISNGNRICNDNYNNSVWSHIAVVRDGSNWYHYHDGTRISSYAAGGSLIDENSDFRVGATGNVTNAHHGYIDQIRFSDTARYTGGTLTVPSGSNGYTVDANTKLIIGSKYSSTGTNATGTAIQAANAVGSAKTKVGGTMLYKDNAGTATLGTDLKIYFTCNGGTNWTEASSYSAITPVYSTGIKQVRLGETTCTSGTDVRYKAVWANQAASSKETQLHGIGVNY